MKTFILSLFLLIALSSANPYTRFGTPIQIYRRLLQLPQPRPHDFFVEYFDQNPNSSIVDYDANHQVTKLPLFPSIFAAKELSEATKMKIFARMANINKDENAMFLYALKIHNETWIKSTFSNTLGADKFLGPKLLLFHPQKMNLYLIHETIKYDLLSYLKYQFLLKERKEMLTQLKDHLLAVILDVAKSVKLLHDNNIGLFHFDLTDVVYTLQGKVKLANFDAAAFLNDEKQFKPSVLSARNAPEDYLTRFRHFSQGTDMWNMGLNVLEICLGGELWVEAFKLKFDVDSAKSMERLVGDFVLDAGFKTKVSEFYRENCEVLLPGLSAEKVERMFEMNPEERLTFEELVVELTNNGVVSKEEILN